MAIQRWDPLRDLLELQERIKHLFDDVMSRSQATGEPSAPHEAAWRPPMDLFEEDSRYVLKADLPGVSAAQVEIRVDGETLVLTGERPFDREVSREAYLRIERPHGRFAVRVALPPTVDAPQIRALHRNGVIEVVLPKRKQAEPSRIPVASEPAT